MENTTGRGLGNPHLFIILINLRFCGTEPINISLSYNINPVLGCMMEYASPLHSTEIQMVVWTGSPWIRLFSSCVMKDELYFKTKCCVAIICLDSQGIFYLTDNNVVH